MKLRLIIIPKTKIAEEALEFGEEYSPNDVIQIKLSDEEFNVLYNNDIFFLINKAAGCMIDDYETDEITHAGKIMKVINILSSEDFTVHDSTLNSLVRRIVSFFEKALLYKTSIHFYF